MVSFQMVKYHSRNYPQDIPLEIEEIAAHFDITAINNRKPYSLHTEYSYGKRNLDSSLLSSFPNIVVSAKEGVPQLWKSEAWALEFAGFLVALTDGKPAPSVIEIHPPFSDYSDMDRFTAFYTEFEHTITKVFPNIEILIENRSGSIYHGGKFILSKTDDLLKLVNTIESKHLKLKLALDIPQLYTAHNVTNRKTSYYAALLAIIREIRDYIGGVHLWGKRKSDSGRKVAHCGDLTSYFEGDESVKQSFLRAFMNCFDDKTARKLVLEVNSGDADLLSIIEDLRSIDVAFQ